MLPMATTGLFFSLFTDTRTIPVSWNKKLLAKYSETVCLDSTHNTCKGPSSEKMFLSTILARDRVTGRGVLLAWLITNHESQYVMIFFFGLFL